MTAAGGQIPVRLGVVMLCHDNLALAARMARVWAKGGAVVAIHVDAKAGSRALDDLKAALADLPDVIFTPRHRCEWGKISLVQATLDAAEALLRAAPGVTHVMTVSGACLPLRPIAELADYLRRRPDRDFIESVNAMDVGWTVGGLNEERFTLRFPFSYRRQRKLFDRHVRLQRRLRVRRRIPEGLSPHLGSQWWCLTRNTLSAILHDPRRAEFDRFFRRVWIPDESYFQTLVRRHSIGVESRSLTLARFDGQGKPYVFYDDHGDVLAQSRCFVARKIWPRATGLYDRFPAARPKGGGSGTDDPDPYTVVRLLDAAVARGKVGRPGLYMQSRFPRKDCENGKTSAPYTVLYGFAEAWPGLSGWLSTRLDADVHGHLFDPDAVEFSGGRRIGPGALSDSVAIRDRDPQGFLTSLIRLSDRPQMFHFSPRDNQALNWFMVTDPNARLFVITGAWAVPLLHSGMPFDDIRRVAAHLQRRELAWLSIVESVWVKAQVTTWTLAQAAAHPDQPLAALLGDGSGAGDPPALADLTGMRAFLNRLRDAGLRPRRLGDFRHVDVRLRAAAPPLVAKDAP